MTTDRHELWKTRLGVILAVAGSAVGLGNFLRFPGQVVQNGGGAFMIPYIVALFLVGIPVGWAEWTMGRYGGQRRFHSSPGILGLLAGGRWARYVGAIGVLIPLVVYMYYVNIEAWCLRYTVEYVVGGMDLGADPAGYAEASTRTFADITGAAANGITLRGGLHPSVVFWAIVFALNVYFVSRGLSAGIEKFCLWAMPTMAVCAVIVLIRVLTLGMPDPAKPEQNVINALGFMWNPDLSRLGDFKTWLAAAGQIFFSLSVGFGIIINYASYLGRRSDVVLSGLTSASTNETFEVAFGGLITVPAAFIFLGASAAIGGTFGLGFNTLPVVFAYMGPAGRLIGGVWFFMLFLAAITSSLSMLQPVKAFLQEFLGLSGGRAVFLMTAVAAVGSFWVIYFSQDLIALDTMDFWVGTTLIFIMATVQIIIFAWVYGVDRGLAEAHRGAHMRIPRVYRIIFKYVAPTYLLVVFAGFCIQSLPDYVASLAAAPVAAGTVGLIGAILGLILVAVWLGERRWRAHGLDRTGAAAEERT